MASERCGEGIEKAPDDRRDLHSADARHRLAIGLVVLYIDCALSCTGPLRPHPCRFHNQCLEVRSMSRSLRAALRLLMVVPLIAAAAATAHTQKSKSRAKESKNQTASPASKGAGPDSAFLSTLKWRFIGPEGNRTDAIAGVPGDPNIYYAGAASGGVWKTTDGGAHWNPIFDDQPVQSIGSIAVAPSDPNVVYVGTGEPYIRSHISVGWGMFKSTDAGKSWSRAGLEN
ncbi:MAG TPA: hypothetical protein VKZ50_03085, partial [bacterium]|nr:hypothetical protein [bacterium]